MPLNGWDLRPLSGDGDPGCHFLDRYVVNKPFGKRQGPDSTESLACRQVYTLKKESEANLMVFGSDNYSITDSGEWGEKYKTLTSGS